VGSGASEEQRQRARGRQFRFASLGLEFGAGIAGCTLLGYWIDRTFGTGHIGLLAGALIGCVGGMYHLVTQAIRLQKLAEQDARRQRAEEPHAGGRDQTDE
jgi:F0F1-type ATP synthase assembly protein I